MTVNSIQKKKKSKNLYLAQAATFVVCATNNFFILAWFLCIYFWSRISTAPYNIVESQTDQQMYISASL